MLFKENTFLYALDMLHERMTPKMQRIFNNCDNIGSFMMMQQINTLLMAIDINCLKTWYFGGFSSTTRKHLRLPQADKNRIRLTI